EKGPATAAGQPGLVLLGHQRADAAQGWAGQAPASVPPGKCGGRTLAWHPAGIFRASARYGSGLGFPLTDRARAAAAQSLSRLSAGGAHRDARDLQRRLHVLSLSD